MTYCKIVFLSLLFFTACSNPAQKKEMTGEELARIHCGSCHLFPNPGLLDKRTWKEDVMPAMAKQLGIDYLYETVLPGRAASVTVDEWQRMLVYYIQQSPDVMPAQGRPAIQKFTDRFIARTVALPKGSFPSTSFIKIDEGNHWIYAASSFDSSINIYDAGLNRLSNRPSHAAVVDINFNGSLLQAGERTGVITSIGIMNPNDLLTGHADTFSLSRKGAFTNMGRLFDSLPRPVQVTPVDLDNDGRQDYLICGFGNTNGALYWMKAKAGAPFEKALLYPLPGAIKTNTEDMNNDGLPDIVTLMAQAREGIFLFTNKGNGLFEKKELLSFPPINGSSYFELVDFNKDGYKDILYTCGDNGDYSIRALKYYHGVYIFLNDGRNNFRQAYFFPVNGCYKAMAKDFDKDGDLDIAAISYFPDVSNQPQESFVYLEQTAALRFEPFSVKSFNEGRWMTMDSGDLDGDGYDDIVLGNLIPPITGKIEEWKSSGVKKSAFLLLHNDSKKLAGKK